VSLLSVIRQEVAWVWRQADDVERGLLVILAPCVPVLAVIYGFAWLIGRTASKVLESCR